MQKEIIKMDGHQIEICHDGTGNEVILFVPGFSVPLEIWSKQLKAFPNRRVFSFNLLGRGGSEKPRGIYDLALFYKQLSGIVDYIGEQKLHLVGTSMGGAIAAKYASENPEKLLSLTLACPAGLSDPLTWDAKLFRLRFGIGELLIKLASKQLLQSTYDDFDQPDENLKRVIAKQLDDPGFLPALVSTLRYFPFSHLEVVYRDLAKTNLPVHFLWGERDDQIKIADLEKLLEIIPHASHQAFSGGRHNIVYDLGELVNQSIYEFLNSINKESQRAVGADSSGV